MIRCRALLVGLAAIEVMCLFPARAEGESAYARATRESILLAGPESWYLEEFDERERPVSAVRWVAGEISEEYSWMYGEGSDVVRFALRTGKTFSEETSFDSRGNLERRVRKAQEGAETRDEYGYDGENRIVLSTSTDGSRVIQERFEYGEDGTVSKRTVYTDGVLSLVAVYENEDSWIETVYVDNEPALIVAYRDGVRVKGGKR